MPVFQKQNRSLWLIFSSLTLLVMFQAFWLQKVWQEQRESLQQETNFLFQQTVQNLQDSLVQRSMVHERKTRIRLPMPPSGLPDITHWEYKQDARAMMALKTTREHPGPDSFSVDQVQVFITTTDSAGTFMEPGGVDRILSKISLPEGEPRKFSFRISRDTIPTDSISSAYRRALLLAEVTVPFSIAVSDEPSKPVPGVLRTDPAFSGLLTHRFYTAEFPDYNGYLLRKMLPHILFSLLLFGITAAAFRVIYFSLMQQQRLTALKNDFIGNITHELKTPITTVGVALEALSDFEVLKNPEQTREYLSISKLELERLTLLVEKVLRLSMFEEKQPRIKPEPVDLTALVRQVLNAMKLQAESAGARIRFEVEDDKSFQVNGDRLHLTSVVFNLIDNALKYRGVNPLEITVVLQTLPGNKIRLTVQDNGIGIPSEYQSKVFDKFFRVPSGNTHNVKGHGLGLSYVANVVQQHGGSIRVESEDGKGSRFVVELGLA